MSKKKISFAPLPIYSITTFKNFIYFSGGGGGKTGIPNQILIYNRTITKQPISRISTGTRLYQNMTTSIKYQLMLCSANEKLLLYEIQENGKNLQFRYEIEVDQSLKNATINTICFGANNNVVGVGGDDGTVRFYRVWKDKEMEILWEHGEHREPIRKIDSKEGDLFVSTDTEVAVIANMEKRQIIRKVYRDQLSPYGSLLQSAYFYSTKNSSDLSLLLCHYIPRSFSYLTRELPNSQLMTLQISKDQSCYTSKQSPFLGIACGGGQTFIINYQQMSIVNKQKGHQAVITAGIMTKGRRFITGTSSCSYLMQESQGKMGIGWIIAVVITVLIVMVVGVGIGEAGSEL